ncbi:MAG: hypothetical protein C0508_06690 [Cyanobacteria bacterium PR.023]|nr:hypothetical protein [Cyanobacteria bacterium PR.023]
MNLFAAMTNGPANTMNLRSWPAIHKNFKHSANSEKRMRVQHGSERMHFKISTFTISAVYQEFVSVKTDKFCG